MGPTTLSVNSLRHCVSNSYIQMGIAILYDIGVMVWGKFPPVLLNHAESVCRSRVQIHDWCIVQIHHGDQFCMHTVWYICTFISCILTMLKIIRMQSFQLHIHYLKCNCTMHMCNVHCTVYLIILHIPFSIIREYAGTQYHEYSKRYNV